MDTLKTEILLLIGGCIDEECLTTESGSFVEMDKQVVHYAGKRGERYFRVELTEVDEDKYFDPIEYPPLDQDYLDAINSQA